MRIHSFRSALSILSSVLFLSGCLSVRPLAEVTSSSGVVVESLSCNLSLSYSSSERGLSGNGYLMYRKPDQLRVVILSPFGSVIQEVFASGDQITIVDAGNGIAFSGSSTDLPEKGDFSGWRYIHWLIDIDPPDPSRGNAPIERVNRFGQFETAMFEKGLLTSKATAAGGRVTYATYTVVGGAALPLKITYETITKEKFSLQLEEPEINIPLNDSTFTPDLSKLHVYPLSSLR